MTREQARIIFMAGAAWEQNATDKNFNDVWDDIQSKLVGDKPNDWEKIFKAYGKPFTSGRDLWDWLKNNCKVSLISKLKE